MHYVLGVDNKRINRVADSTHTHTHKAEADCAFYCATLCVSFDAGVRPSVRMSD